MGAKGDPASVRTRSGAVEPPLAHGVGRDSRDVCRAAGAGRRRAGRSGLDSDPSPSLRTGCSAPSGATTTLTGTPWLRLSPVAAQQRRGRRGVHPRRRFPSLARREDGAHRRGLPAPAPGATASGRTPFRGVPRPTPHVGPLGVPPSRCGATEHRFPCMPRRACPERGRSPSRRRVDGADAEQFKAR